MNDSLLLYNSSLSLSNLAGSVRLKLQPRVNSVSNHCAEAEESCCCVRRGWNCRDGNRNDKVEHCPQCVENQLDLNPRDSKETLDDMKDVKHKQNAGEPKANHCDCVKKCSACQICVLRDFDRNEASQIKDLHGIVGQCKLKFTQKQTESCFGYF